MTNQERRAMMAIPHLGPDYRLAHSPDFVCHYTIKGLISDIVVGDTANEKIRNYVDWRFHQVNKIRIEQFPELARPFKNGEGIYPFFCHTRKFIDEGVFALDFYVHVGQDNDMVSSFNTAIQTTLFPLAKPMGNGEFFSKGGERLVRV